MSLRVNDKQLLKSYNKIQKKIEKLMSIDFESKPIYGDTYIHTYIHTYISSLLSSFLETRVGRFGGTFHDAPPGHSV